MNKVESAKELVNERLKGLKDEITAEDRREAEDTLELSGPTLHKYLNGEGPNPDLGIKMYEFFIGRIRQRIERLKAIA
jgi:hypothetical protein